MRTSPLMLRHVLVLALAALAAGTASADVYKYTDAKGNVLYTDKPATLPAERIGVQSQRTNGASMQARQTAEQQRMQDADRARQAAANQQADQQEGEQITAKDKAERCTKARQRYESYMTSQRLYEQQENGQRRYLSDQELDAARNSAKTTMDVMCK